MSKKLNTQGKVFGFVRFGNVKNVDKLTKALNDVTFGIFRVFAKVARYDRFAKYADTNRKTEVVQGSEGEKIVRNGVSKEVGGDQKNGEERMERRKTDVGGGGLIREEEGVNIMEGNVVCARREEEERRGVEGNKEGVGSEA